MLMQEGGEMLRKRQFKKQQKKLLAQQPAKKNQQIKSSEAFKRASDQYQKIPQWVRNKGVSYLSEYLQYKKLARKADSRLRAIESYAQQTHYKGIERYAYARAMRDIELWSGSGKKRFDTKPPDTLEGIRAKVNDIKTFLESPTSTKAGVTDIYKKRADTINKEYGTNFTWQELADYYTSTSHEKAAELYGSSTELLAFAAETHRIDVNAIRDTLKRKYANIDYVRQELKKKGWKVSR